MLNGIFKPLKEIKSYNQIVNGFLSNKKTVLATNVVESEKIHLSSALQAEFTKPGLYIASSETRAKEIFDDLKYYLKDKVHFYPSKDILFYNADVRSMDITKERFKVIDKLLNDSDITIVLSIEALFDRLSPKDILKDAIINLQVAQEVSKSELINELCMIGYERCELVENQGQFAVRGGIIDIFPVNTENAIRLEFWGDEIDSIRLLDSHSQRSIEKIGSIMILPVRELVYDNETLNNAITKINTELKKTLASYEKKSLLEERDNLNRTFSEVIEKMQNLKNFNGVETYSNYFYENDCSLLDYIKPDTFIFIDEPNRVTSQSEQVYFEFEESIKNRILKGYVLPSGINMVISYDKIIKKLKSFKKALLVSVVQTIKEFTVEEEVSFDVKSTSVLHQTEFLIQELNYYKDNKYRILLLAGSTVRGERILKELSENGFSCTFESSLEGYDLKESVVTISTGSLNKSFEYPFIRFVVITDKELFNEKSPKKDKRKQKTSKIESFTDLRVGDYIVHENHGIGIYSGIEKIVTNNVAKDYLKLTYKDSGHLYVSTNQMDLIQKYIGSTENSNLKLSKLGGLEWKKAKQKAKKQVTLLAKDLIELYAKRTAKQGYSFSRDNTWQREFESMFPFEETEDQTRAIEDVKRDMESPKVMDRLICGDVGYGKTEIAIRATFKAVQDGKQVVFLVPTTILASQHYNTFTQRFADYPIKIEMLSRFRTAKQQKDIIDGVKNGTIDVVIGTHKVLGKEVSFKNLGLIVIDEEQRFGVAQKDKLKKAKLNTDVLALSATPIPRTLHMSLSGIRDISTLKEPPLERKPIQTYVMEHNEGFVKDAISREIGRGGQVFYLYNRVQTIQEETAKLRKLLPNVEITYAHGQMSERELENIMIDFIEGRIEVLVCTTIIETGMDISNANTIIINDADRMGLSQLYQLRGRVGRSSRTSYAYLMYKRDKVLTEVAEKRLQTIREFTEFGSGFKVAMRDLEIRGSGNLLGAEQHGFISDIGYDLYTKLLDREIKNLKGEDQIEDFETYVDVNINAYIPDFYIPNEEQKLEIYKKIASIITEEDYNYMQEEIEDRYGDLPTSVQNLLDVAITKAIAHNNDIISIYEKSNTFVITFKADAKIEPDKLTMLLKKYKTKLTFATANLPFLTYKLDKNLKTEQELKTVKEIILMLK